MSWIRKHWRLALTLGITGTGFILFLILWICKRIKEANQLRAQLALLNAGAKVAGLEADKTARADELRTNAKAAESVDKEIMEAKKAAISVVQEVEKMSDKEIEDAFHTLGY